MAKDFQDKLIDLIMEETKNKPFTNMTPELSADIVEALASTLGTHIALQCRGDAKAMNDFLEGASAYMFECATEKQKAGKFIADLPT